MAALAGRNPFLDLEKMDIDILPSFMISGPQKALDAANIIYAALQEQGAPTGELDSGIRTAIATHTIAGAMVTIDSEWGALWAQHSP
jgi:hypothetical protein